MTPLNLNHRESEEKYRRLAADLQQTLDQVKTLRGLIPICVSCKKIRDDKNCWHQLDSYISAHTDATFPHGICPDCMKKLPGSLGACLTPRCQFYSLPQWGKHPIVSGHWEAYLKRCVDILELA